jgi:hypothetical protein
MHDADSTLQTSRYYFNTHLVLYHSGNFEMSIHSAWEDLPLNVTGYCSGNADMEAEGGNVKELAGLIARRNCKLKPYYAQLISIDLGGVICCRIIDFAHRETTKQRTIYSLEAPNHQDVSSPPHVTLESMTRQRNHPIGSRYKTVKTFFAGLHWIPLMTRDAAGSLRYGM